MTFSIQTNTMSLSPILIVDSVLFLLVKHNFAVKGGAAAVVNLFHSMHSISK